ncbi:hypothetical protein Vadar_025861 [Vaccinium darrowii]|uniref:Uncharacterized protein n=1 Tax=Vaccinium darrowii TaxID=229202 RepID=A0ACB7Y1K3_9ERIC|nr:hypothetical protein Vadar_025861 [Vaccinium darrowii]
MEVFLEQRSRAIVGFQNHSFRQNSSECPSKPSLSYAEALRGVTSEKGNSMIKSIVVSEVTDPWLHRSAMAKRKSFQPIKVVHKLFTDSGFESVQIRTMGGLILAITFQTQDLLDSMLAEDNLFFSSWFVSFRKWDGQACPPSRNMWLSCFGIPLNVWCDNTFLSIGSLWGDVVALKEKTQKSLAFDKGRVLVATDWERKSTHSETVDEEDEMAPELYKLPHIEGCMNDSHAKGNVQKDSSDTSSHNLAIREEELVVGEHQSLMIKLTSMWLLCSWILILVLLSPSMTYRRVQKEETSKSSKLGFKFDAGNNDGYTSKEDGLLEASPSSSFDLSNRNSILMKEADCLSKAKEHDLSYAIPDSTQSIHEEIESKKDRVEKKRRRRLLTDILYNNVKDSLDASLACSSADSTHLSSDNHIASISFDDITRRNAIIVDEIEDIVLAGKRYGLLFHENDGGALRKLMQMELEEQRIQSHNLINF